LLPLSAAAEDEHHGQTVDSRFRTWERLSTAILAGAEAAGEMEWIVGLSPATQGSAVA
jgi:hypothetical protein